MAEGNESGKQPSTVDQEEMDDWYVLSMHQGGPDNPSTNSC